MPLKFWDEAFNTAVFIINCLPSKVIDDQTPYERLFGSPPDYTFLRTFGCAVWPNLRPYNSKKLEFLSKQCVFLGYSNMNKGFKCLDPKEGRVYISCDVVFDEHVFPFASLHPNAGARLRSELALLPDVLKNPSPDFGDANLHDQRLLSPASTNVLSSPGAARVETGTNAEENHQEVLHGGGYHMCSPTENSSCSELDSPGTGQIASGRSASGSESLELSGASSSSSGATRVVGIESTEPHHDPSERGTSTAPMQVPMMQTSTAPT